MPELPPLHAALLRHVAQRLAFATDTDTFLREVLDEIHALLRPALAHILFLSRDSAALIPAATTAATPPVAELPLDTRPAVSAALANKQPALIEQAAEPALIEQLQPLFPVPIGSLFFLPLVARGKPIGAFALATAPDRGLAALDTLLIELLGSTLTGALYGERLGAALERRNQQFNMVADIAEHVSSSLEPREVNRLIVQKLREYFHVSAGSLLRRDQDTDELVFVMTLEEGEEKLHGARVPPGMGIAGHVAQTQQYHIANDVQHDPLHYSRIEEQVGFTTENMLCVPMVVKGNTVGVIELINKVDGAFTEEEAQRLMAIADIIGVAIENARLFEFVRQRRDRLEEVLDLVMRGLPQDKLVERLARELQTQDTLLLVKFNNPYIVGSPVLKPEMCFGRELLFKRIMSVLHQNSLLLHGERRIGKTTLLKQLERRLNNADDIEYRFKPVYIDLQGLEEGQFFHHIMEEVLDRFGKRARGLPLRFTPTRATYAGRDFQHDLRTVITTLCGPQPDGWINRLILLLDEADVMRMYDERILQEFRRIFMNDYAANLGVVISAVEIQRQWKRYESPLYNLFQPIEVPPLTRHDTEQLIRTPVRGLYTYEDAAVELIYTLSGGRPMKVQHLCLESINYIREQGRTNVTADDVGRMSEAIKGQDLWL